MEFDIHHHVPVEPRAWWGLLSDQSFLAYQDSLAKIERRQLANESGAGENGQRLYRVRFEAKHELPGFMKRILGADRLWYELTQHIDDEGMKLVWVVKPPISEKRFYGRGTFHLEPNPAGGCERYVHGRIEVSIRLVGGKIEQMLAKEIIKGHEVGAQAAERWLLQGPQSV